MQYLGFSTTSMVPVIGETVLRINPTLLGILVGAEGAVPDWSLLIAGVKKKTGVLFIYIWLIYILYFNIYFFNI